MSVFVKLLVVAGSVAMAIALLALAIFVAVKVCKLFQSHRDDSDFGKMSYWWGCWSGSAAMATGAEPIPIYLPGDRTEPDARSRKLLLDVQRRWGSIEQTFLDKFAEEILTDDLPLEAWADYEAAAKNRDTAQLRSLSSLANISVERHEETEELRVWVNFLHEWDPEHTRSLVLNEDLSCDGYGLTCGM